MAAVRLLAWGSYHTALDQLDWPDCLEGASEMASGSAGSDSPSRFRQPEPPDLLLCKLKVAVVRVVQVVRVGWRPAERRPRCGWRRSWRDGHRLGSEPGLHPDR